MLSIIIIMHSYNALFVIYCFRIRRVLFRVENVLIPDFSNLDSASRHVCTLFKAQYLKTLERELPSVKR